MKKIAPIYAHLTVRKWIIFIARGVAKLPTGKTKEKLIDFLLVRSIKVELKG